MTDLEIVLMIIGGLLLIGNVVWLKAYLDLKRRLAYTEEDEKFWKNRAESERKSAKYWFKQFQNLPYLPIMKLITIKNYSTKDIENELKERKLKENYPLAYEIKHLKCKFVELYEDGKFKDKYTKEYAWEYVKKYGKDKDIVYKAVE